MSRKTSSRRITTQQRDEIVAAKAKLLRDTTHRKTSHSQTFPFNRVCIDCGKTGLRVSIRRVHGEWRLVEHGGKLHGCPSQPALAPQHPYERSEDDPAIQALDRCCTGCWTHCLWADGRRPGSPKPVWVLLDPRTAKLHHCTGRAGDSKRQGASSGAITQPVPSGNSRGPDHEETRGRHRVSVAQ